jgi:hypothetical protein
VSLLLFYFSVFLGRTIKLKIKEQNKHKTGDDEALQSNSQFSTCLEL